MHLVSRDSQSRGHSSLHGSLRRRPSLGQSTWPVQCLFTSDGQQPASRPRCTCTSCLRLRAWAARVVNGFARAAMACDGPAASTQAASQSKRDMARCNQTPGTTVWLCCEWRPFERCGGLAPVEGRLSHRGARGETGCFCTHLGANAGTQDEHRRRRPPQSFADGALGLGLSAFGQARRP